MSNSLTDLCQVSQTKLKRSIAIFNNPLRTAETVTFDQPIERDIYDTVSGQFLARGVRGPYTLQIDADQTFVLVLTPPGGHCRIEGTKLFVDDIVVDYRIATQRD